MNRFKISFVIHSIAAIALTALSTSAQLVRPIQHDSRSAKSQQVVKAIHVNVEMVLVNVGVVDLEDRPITNLQKDNFRIFEGDTEQEIVSFSHDDTPTSIEIVFDTSGSMADKIDRSRDAVMQLIKTSNTRDEFLLVSFSNHTKLTGNFTSNIEEIHRLISTTKAGGATALLDAIHLGMTQMKYARYHKCAMVVISDGGDNRSWHSESKIRRDLKEADCQLYAMGIYDRADMTKTIEEHNGPKLLSELAEISGGHAFQAWSLDELPRIAATISMELRDEYLLGYRPTTAHDGRWRNIKVTVNLPADLLPIRIDARRGYYTPKE
jgi:Ca-activated chloride channel family protein